MNAESNTMEKALIQTAPTLFRFESGFSDLADQRKTYLHHPRLIAITHQLRLPTQCDFLASQA